MKWTDALSIGNAGEGEAARFFSLRGWQVTPKPYGPHGTDFLLAKDRWEFSADVKARQSPFFGEKVNRRLLVETRTTNLPGWIYSDQSQLIVFFHPDVVILAERDGLVAMLEDGVGQRRQETSQGEKGRITRQEIVLLAWGDVKAWFRERRRGILRMIWR